MSAFIHQNKFVFETAMAAMARSLQAGVQTAMFWMMFVATFNHEFVEGNLIALVHDPNIDWDEIHEQLSIDYEERCYYENQAHWELED